MFAYRLPIACRPFIRPYYRLATAQQLLSNALGANSPSAFFRQLNLFPLQGQRKDYDKQHFEFFLREDCMGFSGRHEDAFSFVKDKRLFRLWLFCLPHRVQLSARHHVRNVSLFPPPCQMRISSGSGHRFVK